MRIAVEGCCHGELDRIFARIQEIERADNAKIDLLLICGDFQSIRNHADLASMVCPDKYKSMGSFYRYYTGQAHPPCPVIFVGGNHEASNYLWELFHGGWVSPDIYFLGFAGVVRFGGLRISGVSGIYKDNDYDCGYYERQPLLNKSDQRSIYHSRKFNTYRLAQIRQPLDVFLSHDWPRGIDQYGDTRRLLQMKKFFTREVQMGTLGSPPNEFLLKRLKPRHWFSAHLHVKFAATFPHLPPPQVVNPDEIEISIEDDDENDGEEKCDPQPAIMAVVNPEEIEISIEVDEDDAEEEQVNAKKQDRVHQENDPEKNEVVVQKAVPVSATSDFVHVVANPDEIEISIEDDEDIDTIENNDMFDQQPAQRLKTDIIDNRSQSEAVLPPTNLRSSATSFPPQTHFLALDKCLPNREYLQIIDIPLTGSHEMRLEYDKEWLAIVKATNELMSLSRYQGQLPDDSIIQARINREIIALDSVFGRDKDAFVIPRDSFVLTAPPHNTPQAQAAFNQDGEVVSALEN